MVITTGLRNIKDTGFPIRARPWAQLTANVWQLGLSDCAMVLSTAVVLPMQRIFRRSTGALRWAALGMPIQSIYQCLWLAFWVSWPFWLHWNWTAQVFFLLHAIVLLMKMHSYAFYNGHLGTTEARLSALDRPETASKAAAVRYPRTEPGPISDTPPLVAEEKAAPSGQDVEEELMRLRGDLAYELTSPLGRVTFPQNLTWANYCDFLMCPTLCYELEYPRTAKRHWLEIFWKTLAVFGCIFLLTITSEEFMVPVLTEAAYRLGSVHTWSDRGLIMAETISMLLFPFMVSILLVFLAIFEYALGALAEITCFADRHFYADWWNSRDWYQARPLWFLTFERSDDIPGSSSPGGGTYPYTTSSGVMYTARLGRTSRGVRPRP
jgi:sterol O-acyltransferase